MKKEKTIALSVYAAIFVVVLLFTCLTPMVADDYTYAFSFRDGERITSAGQLIPSLAAHRETVNGRMFSHALAQLFLMLPKAVFNICNALHACFLLFLISRLLNIEERPILLLCGALMLWLFVPAFGNAFFWLDGALNYSWGMSAFLIYLYMRTLNRGLSTNCYTQCLFPCPSWRELTQKTAALL